MRVNTVLLDVFNMVPGGLYGIGAKDSVDTDPFNTWELVSVFVAQAPDEQLSGTASAPKRFYTAVDLDSYLGPSVSIASPASGATVNGDVPLQVQVTDILPLISLKVYVGGIEVGVIQPGQDGRMTLPTRWFPNGQHEIWALAVNEGVPVDTDGDLIADEVATFQASANITLNFSNEVYMQNYSPLYSAAGSITLQYTASSPQDYTFEVFGLSGDLLHTTSGFSTGGSIDPQWNFTDLLGNPVNDAGYAFSLSYSPNSGGQSAPAAAASKILTTNFVDKGVGVGKYVVSYGTWPSSSLNFGLAGMNSFISARMNAAALFNDDVIGPGRENYNTIHADFSSDPFPIVQATQTNDLTALTNALKDSVVGSWLFEGHSGPVNLIRGRDGHLAVDLTPKQVARLLGNDYRFVLGSGFSVNYGRRLFSIMITGCSAATTGSEYPDATGTPPGVNQVGNPLIKKTAFLGFSGISYAGETKFDWIKRIHFEWLDGADYDTPLNTAVAIANAAYPAVVGWGPVLFGYGPLEYNANESR
jgi:hypothetical protein